MNALVLLETRPIDVEDCLDRHLKHLPADWVPVVVCSIDNQDMIGHKKIVIPRITPKSYLHDYNFLFASVDFYDKLLEYDRILVCHQDSGLLRAGIEEFMEWDYVGAPWKFQTHGGNGGLSLRNPEMMRYISLRFPYSRSQGNEDVYFSNIMHREQLGRLAPPEVCKRFSVEAIYQLGTLGYHNVAGHLPGQAHEIYNQYCKVQ